MRTPGSRRQRGRSRGSSKRPKACYAENLRVKVSWARSKIRKCALSSASSESMQTELHQASNCVTERLQRDERILHSANLDTVQNAASTSSEYALATGPEWQPIQLRRSIPLPEALLDQYDVREARYPMGLFPEIERAWFAIDHRLVLWDYLDGNAFMTYEGLTDVIWSVALVPPKSGYFVDDIKHVLVLATPMTVRLVGIAKAPSQGLGFYLTDLEANTNGIHMNCITATSSGRIFMAGSDGHLYELDYQLSSGWFRSSSSCTLKNHTGSAWAGSLTPWMKHSDANYIIRITVDSSRNYLYTMTKNGALELYWLGADGKAPPQPQAKLTDVASAAALLLPNNPMLDPRTFSIVSIFALTEKESKRFGLVGITSTGVRLYFIFRHENSYYSGGLCLKLAHVRVPPSNPAPQNPRPAAAFYAPTPQQNTQTTAPIQIPTGKVDAAWSGSGGFFVAAHAINHESNTLVFTVPDVGKLSQATLSNQAMPFREVAGAVQVEGPTQEIIEIGAASQATSASMNELVVQATAAPRAFLVLTKRCLNILVRSRPMDILIALLERAQENNQELLHFFEAYGRDQSCSMCLAVIVGSTVQSSTASKAVSQSLPLYTARNISPEVVHWAKTVLYELAGRPFDASRGLISQGVSAPGSNAAVSADGKVVFSGRHESLALYLARLLRPIWKSRITQRKPSPQQPDRQESIFSADFLSAIQKDLGALQAVVTGDIELFIASPDQWSGAADIEAIQVEHSSISSLQALLKQCIEALAFLVLLIDHQLPGVLSTCPKDMQDALLNLSFQDLLSSQNGRDIARKIVSAIINMQISRGQSIDAVSDTLQRQCGSFCSADDVYLHKAADNLRRAKDSPNERESCLRESLRMYSQAAKQLNITHLKELSAEYSSLRFASGAVELALQCAAAWDVDSKGLSWWHEGCPENDPRQVAFNLRNDCYTCVIETLQGCDQVLNDAASKQQPNSLQVQEADQQRDLAFNRALSSNDQPFHFRLYDWFMEQNKTDDLLSVRTAFLEPYLLRDKPALERYDLLWQYYVRNSLFGKATGVLSALAESTEFGLDLAKRLEYLSLAASQARSQLPSAAQRAETQELLGEAEDKLEVAQVQIEIQRAIIGATELDMDEKDIALAQIDERLYTITELYSEFAEPFNLLESMLLIFYVSDHRDSARVLDIWDTLFEKYADRPEDNRLDALDALIVDLGRRFFPSEAVFPMLDLVLRLEKVNMDYGANSRPGWAMKVMRSAGVPYDAFFEAFDELFRSRIPPFHTNSAAAFLASEGILLLDAWFGESLAHRIGTITSEIAFPAAEIMAAGDRYSAALPPVSSSKATWNRLAKRIRETF